MSTYSPTNLFNVSPFEASVVSGNFEKLSDVLNSSVGDYALVTGRNIKNDRLSLDFTSFRRNTLVESFRSSALRSGGASGDEAFLIITPGATASSEPFGVYNNDYDVSGSGLRFYMRAAGDVQFSSQVSLRRIKSGSVFQSGAGYGARTEGEVKVTAKLMIDSVAEKTIERDIYLSTSNAYANYQDFRGISICFNHIEPNMAAGVHTAHINLTFDFDGLTAASAAYSAIQIKGEGGSTCATAFYK